MTKYGSVFVSGPLLPCMHLKTLQTEEPVHKNTDNSAYSVY